MTGVGRRLGVLLAAGMVACSPPWPSARAEATAPCAATSAALIDDLIAEAAVRFGLPERWIGAVMAVESQRQACAVSHRGALGLMQVMPATYADLRLRYRLGADPMDAHDNVIAGAAYLRELYDQFGLAGALAAYNAGPSRWLSHLATGHPLPLETQDYVARLAPALQSDGAGVAHSPLAPPPPPPPSVFVDLTLARALPPIAGSTALGVKASEIPPPKPSSGLQPRASGLFAPASQGAAPR